MRGKQGYVALLDVLGFEQIIARESYMDDIDRYTEAIEKLSNNPGLEYVLFSDSIVITTDDESETALLNLIRSCSRVFGRLLSQEIPLRGAIAHGSFIRVKGNTGVFLAGRAVVEAYKFEKKQNWVGIMLTPTVLAKLPNLGDLCKIPAFNSTEPFSSRFKWMKYVQPCGSVPFHQSDPHALTLYDGFAVVPVDSEASQPSEMLTAIQQMQRALGRLKSLAPDPQAQKKYDSAQQWLGTIGGHWSQVASSEVWKRL